MPKSPDETEPITAEEQEIIDYLCKELGNDMQYVTFLTLMRFVRGYCHLQDVKKETLKMLQSFVNWYKNEKIYEYLNIKTLDKELFNRKDEFHDLWPHGIHGRGLDGHLIYIDRPGQITPSELTKKFTIDDIIRYHIVMMEELCQLKERVQLKRSNDRGQIDKTRLYKQIVILDLKGMGTKHFSKKFYGPIKAALNIDQNYYPETLHKLFIVNSNWIFKGLWKVMSPFIDPLTKERIEWGTDNIHKYIAKDQLPQFLGGTCNCANGDCLKVPFPGQYDDAATLEDYLCNEQNRISPYIDQKNESQPDSSPTSTQTQQEEGIEQTNMV